MTRLERELLTRIKARLDALDPGAAEKLAVLLPVLRRFAQSYAALGPAAKKTIEALLPELAALLEALTARFSVEADAEITLEINPNSLGCADLSALRRAGFNRLSIGLQSALPKGLAVLGRTHTADDFLRCTDGARRAGFSNLSADMIFAVPGLSVAENALTAAFLADCGPEHISAYELSYEAGTPLTRALEAGTISAHSDEAAGEMYTQICALLRGQGYEHYEISNFAKPGFASRHNLHYWACGEYYAFGAAAHGYLNGRRFSVVRDTDAYIARTRGEVYDESCDDFPAGRISDEEAEEERIFLGLRTAEGILLTPALEAKLEAQAAFFTRCEEAGLLARNGGRLRLTEEGWRVSDSIITKLI